jgi:hypothetical protein
VQLGKILLGGSRASLYAAPLAGDGADRRLVLCPRGSESAVRIRGAVSLVTDTRARTRPRERDILIAGLYLIDGGHFPAQGTERCNFCLTVFP